MKKYFIEKNYSLNSMKTYIYWIKKYLKWSDNSLSIKKIMEYKEKIMEEYSIGTQKIIISALKCMVDFKNINIKLKVPKQFFKYDITIITKEEFEYLMENLIWERTFTSIRNKEMLKIMWFTGMRISEIINLKWSDIKNGVIKIESKNNKKRYIPFQNGMFKVLRTINSSNFVFTKTNNDKLTYSAISTIFLKIKEIRKDITPHSFRHSFATRIIESGVPLNYVSELLGHSNVNTTMIYIHSNLEVIKRILKEKDWN